MSIESSYGIVKENVKCCCCGESMEKSVYIHLFDLAKVAEWDFPKFKNIIIRDDPNHAVAIICDRCIQNETIEAKYAVEIRGTGHEIIYHPIEDLKDLPESIMESYRRLIKALQTEENIEKAIMQRVNQAATAVNEN